MNIKFSVVIPYFNDFQFISICLDSLRKQTYSNFEVILIDDCSQDSVLLENVLNEYSDFFDLKYLRNDKNMNGAYSRNLGVYHSKGDYVCFLDADDYWKSNKLEEVVNFITTEKLGELDVIYSKVSLLTDQGVIGSRPQMAISSNIHMSEYLFLTGGFIQTSTIVVPINLAKRVEFDTRFKRHQDYQYCISLSEVATFKFIDQNLVYYRVPNGIYAKKSEDIEFCLYWLSQLKNSMSNDGYYGYRLFAYNARLINSSKYKSVFINTIQCLFGLSFRGLALSTYKVRSILKSWLS